VNDPPAVDVGEFHAMAMGAMIQLDLYEEAMDIAQQIAEDNPSPAALADISFIAYDAGAYALAQDWSAQALAFDPDRHDAAWIRALVRWELDEDLEGAIDGLNALDGIEFYPAYLHEGYGHTLNIDRARVLADAGDFEAALGYYDLEIEENGWYNTPYIERADLFYDIGDLPAAMDDLRVAIDITQDDEYRAELVEQLTAWSEEAGG
jgi:tetratricopeptide (TPR) repeat protein